MDLVALVATGVVAAVLGGVITLVRIAVRAEQRRGDDWHTIAQTATAANGVLAGQIERLITSVEQLATSQREMMGLLQTLAAERRSQA